jgi:hypothetical protein
MTAAEIRSRTLAIESDQQAVITICELLQEIAAQLADANEREKEAQQFTRSGDWHRV